MGESSCRCTEHYKSVGSSPIQRDHIATWKWREGGRVTDSASVSGSSEGHSTADIRPGVGEETTEISGVGEKSCSAQASVCTAVH